jgi:hypothetical protein
MKKSENHCTLLDTSWTIWLLAPTRIEWLLVISRTNLLLVSSRIIYLLIPVLPGIIKLRSMSRIIKKLI